MKAQGYYEMGGPRMVRCVELPVPEPAEGQVLIQVRASGLNPLDLHLLKGAPKPIRMAFPLPTPSAASPGRIGRDVAGVVIKLGAGVIEFKEGDEVFGSAAGSCAEYVCAAANKLVHKPGTVSFPEAASSPVAAYTALQGLRDHGNIKSGDRVLVNGAAGGVGTFAVQIAKAFGAQVTAVCSSANPELVRSIGADDVVPYDREAFTKRPDRYDIIFDLAGNHSWSACAQVLSDKGVYLGAGMIGVGMGQAILRMALAPLKSRISRQTFITFMARSAKEDLDVIAEMLADGRVKPVLDKIYGLDQVPEALEHLATKRARGKIVVRVNVA